jgi:hypothetical protein
MRTIGHHTCLAKGGKDFVEAEAPFLSEAIEEDNENGIEAKRPFLGTGYYFWDNNTSLAKWWGDFIVKKKYFIVEAELLINDSFFLDLVGNRESMIWFQKMINHFWDEEDELTVGEFIELLKKMAKETGENDVFPFTAIRAIDYSGNHKHDSQIKFASGKKGFTLIQPRMMICLTEKNCDTILNKKVIFAST